MTETRNCQNCKKDFVIEEEDFNFYEKIKVPAPTFCPECRLIRRLAYRENRPLYKDYCRKCKSDLISIFSKKSNIKPYCTSCWWGDSWDATEYGIQYDFSKTFFEQFYFLQKSVPREASGQKNSENCKYSNGNIRCKNCTLTFNGYQSINCYNCETPVFSRDSIDSNIIMNADHVYESVNSNSIYNTKFVYFSDECMDSSFLFNCLGCSDCFGCVNLRNKKYFIYNKQYSKQDYKEEIKKWDLNDYDLLLKAKEKFIELYFSIPRRFSLISNSINVTGDDIKNTKNSKFCFSTRNGVENSKFIFTAGLLLKDSYDAIFGGDKSELFYETSGGVGSHNCFFSRAPNESSDIEYSDRLFNCSFCFGCVHLKNKKYCVFNKQYTKEEYFILRENIIKHMNEMPYFDKKNRLYKYGEFFPSELSIWDYNETWAHKYFPLTKEETIDKGYNWQDKETENESSVDIEAIDLPKKLDHTDESILNRVIGCEHRNTKCNQQCTKVFRILKNELNFYKQMNVALPRLCPNCRDYERQYFINTPRLFDRVCSCSGVESENKKYKNTRVHFHKDKKCDNQFETAISQDRKEIVYCKECYQSEFI